MHKQKRGKKSSGNLIRAMLKAVDFIQGKKSFKKIEKNMQWKMACLYPSPAKINKSNMEISYTWHRMKEYLDLTFQMIA